MTHSKIINFGGMAWPGYIEYHIKMSCVVMRLKCVL